jgi:hypothetical protein
LAESEKVELDHRFGQSRDDLTECTHLIGHWREERCPVSGRLVGRWLRWRFQSPLPLLVIRDEASSQQGHQSADGDQVGVTTKLRYKRDRGHDGKDENERSPPPPTHVLRPGGERLAE